MKNILFLPLRGSNFVFHHGMIYTRDPESGDCTRHGKQHRDPLHDHRRAPPGPGLEPVRLELAIANLKRPV
ncbi:MAG: hypothetical protein PHE55_16485 [Methylococcaceae bacterium]|nr:hypothetical protein [Methylococcaceae bacterium]